MVEVEQNRRKEQRERNGDRDNQRGSHVAQKQEQHHDHQQDSFGQIVEYGVGGEVHQVIAIQVRHNLDALGKHAFVDELYLLVNIAQHAFGLRPFAGLHDAFDCVVVVQQRAIRPANGLADLAQLDLGAFDHRRDIANPHRRAVLDRDDGCADVVDRLHQAHGAHIERLLAPFDVAAAAVHVIGSQRLLDVGQRQSIRHQLVGIELNLVLLGLAAEAGDRSDVGHRHQMLEDHPVLQRLQLHGVVLGIAALQRVPIDLAGRTEVGADLGIDSRRQIDQSELLQHLLAILQILGLRRRR